MPPWRTGNALTAQDSHVFEPAARSRSLLQGRLKALRGRHDVPRR